jgi:rod shape-determining protein MreC
VKKKRGTWLISFVVLALLFFSLHRIFFFSPSVLERLSSYILYPVLQLQTYIVDPIQSRIRNAKTVSCLQQELAQTMLERDELYAQNVALQTELDYASKIKELLLFKKRYASHNQLIVRILLRHISDDAHYVLVDAGEDKKITPDMPVIYKNSLIGRVTEVWPHYSKVVLTTDATCKVAAECLRTKIRGIHQGMNTTQETGLAHVSHLLKLEKNDLLVSSGEGLIFPRGFSLGIIEDCKVNGLTYAVKVRPPFSIHAIDCCSIVRGKA